MLSLLIVLAILVAVIIGYKTKINTGLVAMAFSYIIGAFLMGLKPKEIIGGWPVTTMFVIFSVSLFYNFALLNGTLEKTARLLLYSCRNFPALLPFALYFASAIIAALGAGFFTVMAFMAPITLLICKEAEMDELIGAVAINCGALSGANFMTSGSGVIFRGLIDEAGLMSDSFSISIVIFISSVIFSLLLISLFMILGKRKMGEIKAEKFTKPEKFDEKQKFNLILMILMIVILLTFPILNIIIPNNELIAYINSKMDVGLVAIIFSLIALFTGMADEKEAIAKVPWNTIIMICGVGMLISIAIKAGTIDLLASWASGNLPVWIIPLAFSLIGAIMSFFSSTLGVVCPALFPIVPVIAEGTGINPLILFTAIVIGAQSSAISPFSSGGSLILGSCTEDEERESMFSRLLFIAVPISVLSAMLYNFALGLIL